MKRLASRFWLWLQRVPLLAWTGVALGALAVLWLHADALEQREQVLAQWKAHGQMPARAANEALLASLAEQQSRAREQAHQRQRAWPALTQADAVWLALQEGLTRQGLQVRELRSEAGPTPAPSLPEGSAWRSVHLSVQGPYARWRAAWSAWMHSGWWWRVERMVITPLQADQVLVQATWSLALREGEPLPGAALAAWPGPDRDAQAVATQSEDTALRWVGWYEQGETREAVLALGTQWLRVPVGALVGASGLRLREGSAQTLVLVREDAPDAAPMVLRWAAHATTHTATHTQMHTQTQTTARRPPTLEASVSKARVGQETSP